MSKLEKSIRREQNNKKEEKSSIYRKDRDRARKSRKLWKEVRERKENLVIDIIKEK